MALAPEPAAVAAWHDVGFSWISTVGSHTGNAVLPELVWRQDVVAAACF